MAKTLPQLQKQVDDFVKSRGWTNHNPNSLLASIIIELGELGEHFQWDKEFKKFEGEERESFGFEFVDILFYVFLLADRYDIDIQEFWDKKLPLLEKKFKPGISSKVGHKEYRESGKNKLYK